MPTKQFAIERGGEMRIIAEYGNSWEDLTVSVDGEEVLRSKLMSQLVVGVDGTLPDGRVMRAWLDSGGLALTLDGVPVPDSMADGQARLRPAWTIMLFYAGVALLVGAALLLEPSRPGASMAEAWVNIITGLIYAGLALLVRVKLSKIALAICFLVTAMDCVILLMRLPVEGGVAFGIMVCLRLYVLVWIYRGFRAINMIRARREAQ